MTANTLSQTAASIRLLSMQDMQAEFKLHRTTIHYLVKRGKLPKPIKIGGKSLRWIADEIEAFKAERMASR
jgi:predicted DNA-binding transcriptional regulator AlpA